MVDPHDLSMYSRQLDALRARHAELTHELAQYGTNHPSGVQLVAVTKQQPIASIQAAQRAGFTLFGENYAQELASKAEELPGATFHFIGQLQTNKVKLVQSYIDVYQSVDRESLVTAIAQRSPGAKIMIQVNVTSDERRGGVDTQNVSHLVQYANDAGLETQGLMAVGSLEGPDANAAEFTLVRNIATDLGLEHCSMGMSSDYRIALDCGSTMVRLGSTIFGERK